MKLIYGLFILLIFFSIGIGLLIYSVKKKKRIGIVISIVLLFIASISLFTNKIDELTISKKDVISDLNHINIELKDDFTITHNNVYGMPERIQETEIQISQNDKDRIINSIKNSEKFKSYANNQEINNNIDYEQFGTSNKIFNYKYPKYYSRSTYTKIDNYPTRLFITIYEERNTIKYQRIEN